MLKCPSCGGAVSERGTKVHELPDYGLTPVNKWYCNRCDREFGCDCQHCWRETGGAACWFHQSCQGRNETTAQTQKGEPDVSGAPVLPQKSPDQLRREALEKLIEQGGSFSMADLKQILNLPSEDAVIDYLFNHPNPGIKISYSNQGGNILIGAEALQQALEQIKKTLARQPRTPPTPDQIRLADQILEMSKNTLPYSKSQICEIVQNNPEVEALVKRVNKSLQNRKAKKGFLTEMLNYIFICCEMANDYYDCMPPLGQSYIPIDREAIMWRLNRLPKNPEEWKAHEVCCQGDARRSSLTGASADPNLVIKWPENQHPRVRAANAVERACYAYDGSVVHVS